MRVFPLVKLELRGNRFERRAEFGPKVEWFEGDATVKFLEIGEIAVRIRDGLLTGRVNVIAQETPRPEQGAHRLNLRLEVTEADLGHFLGKAMKTEESCGFQLDGHG
jgi:hypothetical protein